MKILIIGSCRNNDLESKIEKDKKLAEEIGRELAKRSHEITTGGAGGLQGVLVASYKKGNGKKWTVYLAKNEERDENAKPKEHIKPDEEVKTNLDYAVRDASYIEKCDAVIALSGKSLTLAEIIHAVKNYHKRVFQLNIGDNTKIIPLLEELRGSVLITSNIQEGLNYLEKENE